MRLPVMRAEHRIMRNSKEIIFKIDDITKLADIEQKNEIRRLGIQDRRVINLHLRLCRPKSKRLFAKGFSRKVWRSVIGGGTEYFCLFENSKPVARCAIERYSENVWEAADIKTAASHRGKGYQKQLVVYVTRRILKSGKKATCSTLPDNAPMIKVLSAAGYEKLCVTGDGTALQSYLSD